MTIANLSFRGIREADLGTRGYYLALALTFLASLWLRAAFPIYAIGSAGHDDLLYVRMAASIGSGHWLGGYSNLTHAKGAAYSMFLALNHFTGLPIKFSEQVLYLSVALLFSAILGRIYQSRSAMLATFVLLALIPTPWNPGVGGRISRDFFCGSLALLLVVLAVRCFVLGQLPQVAEELREKRRSLKLLGLVAGIFWLTREEAVWLFPSLTIIGAFWLWSRRQTLRPWRPTVNFVALPIVTALLVVGADNSVNYVKYGVFRNNDFRSADYLGAYGAVSRIKHDQWQRYVVFPKDARERAYRFSPAMQELRPHLEGSIGDIWRNAGCRQLEIAPCTEILGGWFMFALRDSVAAAGHYSSARDAQSFYRRLAAEIDAACDQNPGECLPQRATMAPPWRDHYLTDTLYASWQVFRTLVTLGGGHAYVEASVGSAEQLALFASVTNGPLAPPKNSIENGGQTATVAAASDDIRFAIARVIAKAECTIAEFGIPAAILVWLVWGILAIRRRRLDPGLVIASALVAAVASRVVMLGFVEATWLPSNNILYLSPMVPLALALVPTVLFGVVAFARNQD
jgi:hypothetical protein